MQPTLPKDVLYFGSSVTALQPVGGATKAFLPNVLWGDLAGPHTSAIPRDSVDGPRARLLPVCIDGNSIALPAVPASDIAGELPEAKNELPSLLSQPLIKRGAGKLYGIQSGRRSAVVTNGKQWFRLKGCGSHGQGFPREHMFPETKKLERQDLQIVTGCLFKSDALRELHMTEVVNSLLAEHGLVGGNTPVGMWDYDVPHLPPVTYNDTPQLSKHCNLFHTLGDKRLGCHLIVGLEKLLPLMVPDSSASELQALFPESRKDDSIPGGVLRTHQHIFDFARLHKGSTVSPASDEGLVNLCGHLLPETVPDSPPNELNDRTALIWSKAAERLRTVLDPTAGPAGTDFLAHVVWRLGREAGQIRRILSECGIMWGYFFDHDPNNVHNNSEPNNFVLLPPGTNKETDQLLAPIDFDMCFTKSSFLLGACENPDFPLWPTEQTLGAVDEAKFERWLEQEVYMMEMSIGGNIEGYEPTDDSSGLLMTCLRDTCLLGFRSGLRADDDVFPLTGEYKDHVYDIIDLALCLSDQEEQVTRF
eukprot:TRINITY_DN49690_c0_g1_i1.p1 TRINITY_DN49690_c0_g1~~TRINITY_DN49690_c0_g1_i1.p1  ORF type:complete len:533 (-),score=122.61 TRINITY_DN49690_c0_g1_i1:360-1958(-)